MTINKKQGSSKIPQELEGVALTSDVDALDNKVAKCYSAERYEEFLEAVEKIVIRKLETSEGGDKIKKHTDDYFKGKIVWAALLWLITIIATALIQKYFKILG